MMKRAVEREDYKEYIEDMSSFTLFSISLRITRVMDSSASKLQKEKNELQTTEPNQAVNKTNPLPKENSHIFSSQRALYKMLFTKTSSLCDCFLS